MSCRKTNSKLGASTLQKRQVKGVLSLEHSKYIFTTNSKVRQCTVKTQTHNILPNKSKPRYKSIEKVDVEIRFTFRTKQADKLINEQCTQGTNRI